jgi:energy-coupling factor transporter transmembrane protein EcfT
VVVSVSVSGRDLDPDLDPDAEFDLVLVVVVAGPLLKLISFSVSIVLLFSPTNFFCPGLLGLIVCIGDAIFFELPIGKESTRFRLVLLVLFVAAVLMVYFDCF